MSITHRQPLFSARDRSTASQIIQPKIPIGLGGQIAPPQTGATTDSTVVAFVAVAGYYLRIL